MLTREYLNPGPMAGAAAAVTAESLKELLISRVPATHVVTHCSGANAHGPAQLRTE